MAHGSGDEARVARFDDVGPAPAPAPTARWDPVRRDPVRRDPEHDEPAASEDAVRVAAFTGPGVESGCSADAATVADLASVAPAAEATIAADLAAAGGSRPDVAGHTARLADASRGGGRTRRGPGTGTGGEPTTRRRSRDDARPGPRPRPATSTRPPTSTDPAPADDAAPDTDTDRAPQPRRRGGPKQIDPDADPVTAAREICLRLLTDRARTRHELAQALSRRGVPDDAATSVLERFDDVGLIDDAAFAGQWVRSRHNHRGLARRAIAMELRRKGVDDEVASEALEDLDADAEARRARELVDRKLRSLTVTTPEQRTSAARRLVGMLARKGYGAGTAYGVVREALADHGADPDELGAEPADD